MVFLYIICVLSVISALASGFFNLKDDPTKRFVFKLVASLLFCIAGLTALYAKGEFSTYGIFVMGALILGMLGDAFLAMSGLARDDKLMFFNGVGYFCFAAGHIAFAAIFLSVAKLSLYLLPLVLIIPFVLWLLIKMGVLNAGKFNLAIIIYAAVLGIMVMAAVNIFINNKGAVGVLSIAAAALFASSDLALSIREFGKLKSKTFIKYFVLSTYYIAQCLFAITIALY